MLTHDLDVLADLLAETLAGGPLAAEPMTRLLDVGRGSLWLGGHRCAGCARCPALSPGWETVVDLCRCDGRGGVSDPDAYLSLDVPSGGRLSLLQSADACLAAALVAETVAEGGKALVRSHDGLNRGALVGGLALRLLGIDTAGVLALLRARRGGDGLSSRAGQGPGRLFAVPAAS